MLRPWKSFFDRNSFRKVRRTVSLIRHHMNMTVIIEQARKERTTELRQSMKSAQNRQLEVSVATEKWHDVLIG